MCAASQRRATRRGCVGGCTAQLCVHISKVGRQKTRLENVYYFVVRESNFYQFNWNLVLTLLLPF